MQFLDKFTPRRGAPRRGSTAGLLQPEDDIAANSKARRYDKRAVPCVSTLLTRSISSSHLVVTEKMLTMSLHSVTTKRAFPDGAPRRGSAAGLLQPEDGFAADSKARQYDKRAAPCVSDLLTRSLSTSHLAVTEKRLTTKSLHSVTTKRAFPDGAPRRGSAAGLLQPENGFAADSKARRYDKRAAPRVSDLLTRSLSTSHLVVTEKRLRIAPPKRISSLTPVTFGGPCACIGLEAQPDTSWPSTIGDDFGASGNFPIDGVEFQDGSLQPENGVAADSKARRYDEIAAPRSDMLSRTVLTPHLVTEITDRRMETMPPPSVRRTKRASDGGATRLAPPKRMSSLTPVIFLGTSAHVGLETQPDTSWSSTVKDDLGASGNFSLGGGDFQESENILGFDSLVDLESSAAGSAAFASYEHSGAQLLFYYSMGPESFVQFDPNSSEPHWCSMPRIPKLTSATN